MGRISIDVTAEEHQRLKALAALRGQSIKDFVLSSTLGASGATEALAQLEALLDDRARDVDGGRVCEGSAAETFDRVRRAAADEEMDA